MANNQMKDDNFTIQLRNFHESIIASIQNGQIKAGDLLQLNGFMSYVLGEQELLYQQIKMDEYATCDHVVVPTHIDHKAGRTYYGCIACGLNQWVLSEDAQTGSLTQEQEIMQNFLLAQQMMVCSVKSERPYDFTLACAIYSKIKDSYPELDVATIFQYFQRAYEDIEHIDVSPERKIGRAKRLGLHPNYFSNK